MSKILPKLSTYHVVLITENGFPYAVQIADSQVRSPKRRYQRQSQNLTLVPFPYQEAKQLANQARRAYFPDRYRHLHKGLQQYLHTTGNITSVVRRFEVNTFLRADQNVPSPIQTL